MITQTEFYYNYVSRMDNSTDLTMHSKEFRFESMIARMPNIMHKSIGIMDQLFDIADYSDVYIIDDLFEGEKAIWTKHIPKNVLMHGFNVHAFPIPAFVIRYLLYIA